MIRIDGFYLYSTGSEIHPLAELKANDPFDKWSFPLIVAQGALEAFLEKSIYQVRTSQQAGAKLLEAIKALTVDLNRTNVINMYEAYMVTTNLTAFENVLAAELGIMNIYLVIKKRGYDTTDLIHSGYVLFPDELVTKVPEAIADISQATQCIAFELPTAAGFHLHRANESILHRYYDAVTNGSPRPNGRNIGDYLNALKTKGVGEPKLLSALKDLKDLHRNPLIHPDDSLENIDEAIALLGSIHAAAVLMLKEIPAIVAAPATLPSPTP